MIGRPNRIIGAGATIHPTAVLGVMAARTAAQRREIDQSEDDLIIIGERSFVGPLAVLYAGCSIGDDTLIGEFARVREKAVIGNECVIGSYVAVGMGCRVGNRVRMMDFVHVSAGTVIGEGSFLSMHVRTANHAHVDLRDYRAPREGWAPPVIGKRVMVCPGVTINPGVVIGDDAYIYPNSCVAHDVPAGARIAGNPGRIIERRRDDWTEECAAGALAAGMNVEELRAISERLG